MARALRSIDVGLWARPSGSEESMSQTSVASPRRVDRRTMICEALRQSSLVEIHDEDSRLVPNAELRCDRCGISVRVPHVSFDLARVCSICRSFERNRERIGQYFGAPD